MKNPKNICGGFFGGVSRKRRVWGGNPNKYLTGGQMSEKRNLVHWSILALCDCKLPLTSVRHFFTVCINAFCKFSFAYYSFIGSRFWQSVCLFLLLIIRDTGLLPADWNLFALVIQKTRKWQPGRQKNFLVHSKHHRPSCSAKNGRKKSSKSFSRLTASCAAVGRGVIQFQDCPGVPAGT